MSHFTLFLPPNPLLQTAKPLHHLRHCTHPLKTRRKPPPQSTLSYHHTPPPPNPLVITDARILSRFTTLPTTSTTTTPTITHNQQQQQQQQPTNPTFLHTTKSLAEVDVGLRLLTSWVLGTVLARGLGGMFSVSLGVSMMLIFGSSTTITTLNPTTWMLGMSGVLGMGLISWVLLGGGKRVMGRKKGVDGGRKRLAMVIAGGCGVLCGGGLYVGGVALGVLGVGWMLLERFGKGIVEREVGGDGFGNGGLEPARVVARNRAEMFM